MNPKIITLIIVGIAIGTLAISNISNGNAIDSYLYIIGLTMAIGGVIALGTKSNDDDDDDDTPKKL